MLEEICLNSELRWPTVDKWGNFFAIRKLDKVDSAGRLIFLPGTTFFHINGAMICINASIFNAFFKNWPVNINATFEV